MTKDTARRDELTGNLLSRHLHNETLANVCCSSVRSGCGATPPALVKCFTRHDRASDGTKHGIHHPDRCAPPQEGVDTPMDWRDRSACLEEDPELFFPIGNTGPALLQIEQAKTVCRRCEVRDTCLQWALETGQDAGVWGGLSEDERRALKRRRARNRLRTNA